MIYSLLKPGLAFAVLLTVVPGLYLGPVAPSSRLIVMTLFGTMLTAMASFCYNQLLETGVDSLMARTRERALPSGALSRTFVTLLGSSLLMAGAFVLALFASIGASIAAVASFLVYVLLYTALFKPRSEHNTVIGGLSGSIGPLIGEAAVRGMPTEKGFALFFILFLWQPPHFWALAINLKEDYAAANLPMLPVVRGVRYTVNQMLIYQWMMIGLIIASYYPLQIGGLLYLGPSLFMALLVVAMMHRLRMTEDTRLAKRTFWVSIIHVSVHHLALSADLYLRLGVRGV